MWNYKTTTPKDYVEEHCSFYEVVLNDTVREVSVDSMIAHGEREELSRFSDVSRDSRVCVFPMSCTIGFQDVITWRNWTKCR